MRRRGVGHYYRQTLQGVLPRFCSKTSTGAEGSIKGRERGVGEKRQNKSEDNGARYKNYKF